MVGLNTFGGPILAGLGVPLVVLWKREVRGGGVAGEVGRAVAWWLLVVLGWGAVTAGGAGWLRRHLMLYRVFSPKWMMAGGTGLVVQVVVGVVVWWGVGRCVGGVGDVFGWV
jgi:phosphatidylinositol glycan class O